MKIACPQGQNYHQISTKTLLHTTRRKHVFDHFPLKSNKYYHGDSYRNGLQHIDKELSSSYPSLNTLERDLHSPPADNPVQSEKLHYCSEQTENKQIIILIQP